jgi:hypothetical protein
LDPSDRLSRAPFFARSPFRYRPFAVATGLLGLLLIDSIFFLIWGWRRLSIFGVIFMMLAILYVVGIWTSALRMHEEVRTLFETGQLGNPEKGSPLHKILVIITNLLTGGLIATYILVGFCLWVLLDLSRSH